MIISFLWPALLVAVGLINYTSCILQMNSPVSHAQHGFLLVSSKGQIPNDTGDVGTAANDSRSCFTLTIPGCHHTILVPNPAKIFLGRYMAALNAGANNIFCCFTNMDFVVSILLKVFSSVRLSHLNLIYAEGNLTNFLLGESRKIRDYVTRTFPMHMSSGPCPRSRQDDGVRLVGEREI